MSKRHFVALADALRKSKPDLDFGGQWGFDVASLADALAKLSPTFKPARWLAYVRGEVTASGKPITERVT